MLRLNGLMALIAVVCVVGVMGGEILGPMAQLRFSRFEEAGGNEGGRPALGRGPLRPSAFPGGLG